MLLPHRAHILWLRLSLGCDCDWEDCTGTVLLLKWSLNTTLGFCSFRANLGITLFGVLTNCKIIKSRYVLETPPLSISSVP